VQVHKLTTAPEGRCDQRSLWQGRCPRLLMHRGGRWATDQCVTSATAAIRLTAATAQLIAVAAEHAARTAVAAAIKGRAGPSDGLRWPPFSYAVSTRVKLK
jgi:hypothetical protein